MLWDIELCICITLAWAATFLLWLLIQQHSSVSKALARYHTTKLVAWSAFILLQTWRYAIADMRRPPLDISLHAWEMSQITLFVALMGSASCRLLYDLQQPIAIASTPQPNAQIRIDPEGTVIGWNDAATALFGWTAAEMVGQELAAHLVPPTFQEAHRAGLRRFRETAAMPLVNTRYTQLARCKDGREILVDISLTAHQTDHGTTFLGICTPAMCLLGLL